MYSKIYHKGDLSTSRFLITGGAGFIGSHLVEYLMTHKAGKVVILDNLATGSYDNIAQYEGEAGFEFVEGDVNDKDLIHDLCEKVDYVLHQAALGSVPRSIENPLDSHEANATGFLSVLEACRKTSIKRLVYASSSSVYGDSTQLPKKEGDLGQPKSPYAITKLMDELYARLYSTMHGMEIIGLRYFNIFGPRQNPKGPYAAAIPLFIQAALNGESPTIFGDGEQSRDFTFVANAVKANLMAVFSHADACGTEYNVACSEQYSLNEILTLISTFIKEDVKANYRAERKGDIKHSKADISRIRSVMNFDPEFEMKEGLRISLQWYRENYENSNSKAIGQ